MPRIPDNILKATIYLYATEEAALRGDDAGGSGFLASVRNSTGSGSFIYAVTNSHVVREGGSPIVRLNHMDGTVATGDASQEDWFHAEEDDLAVIPVDFDAGVAYAHIPIDMFVTPELIRDLDIGPGDDVFMVGRFLGQAGAQQNLPAARFGNLAQGVSRTSHPRGFEQESFLVEMHSLSGYSGSQVVVYVSPSQPRPTTVKAFYWGLLGVDWAHVPSRSRVRDRDGNLARDEGDEFGWYVDSPSGMARVIPAWRLAALLQRDDLRRERAEAEARAR